jgi:hypothetical protein
MQLLQAVKVLQEIVTYGFAATNLPPQPGRRCGCSVVGGLLIDECDGQVLQW